MNIKEMMLKHATVPVSKELSVKMKQYLIAIMTRTEDSMEWFNSFYFGVHEIRFRDNDKENLYLLLDIDETELKNDIKKLDGVKSSWNIITDPFNVVCALYLRKALESKVSESIKRDFYINLNIIFQYKMITSMYFRYFNYAVSKDMATTLYERLPRKFIIKRLGSNYKVLEHNAISRYESGNWSKVLKRDKPMKFLYYVSNLNTTIKSFILQQYSVLVKVQEEDKLRRTASPVARDGEDNEERVREVNDIHSVYVESIKRKIYIKDDFIDKDLLSIVSELYPRIKIDAVLKTLEHIQQKAFESKEMVDMCVKIIEINNRYLYVEKMYPPYSDRLIAVFKFLKNYWSSSSLKDKDMQDIKNKIIKMVKEVTGIKTRGVLSSSTIIIAVYIYTISITDIKR